MTVTLGATPIDAELVLSPDTGFVCTFRRPSGAWPDGMTAEIRIGAQVWQATVVADEANWDIDSATVDALIATNPRRAQVYVTIDGVPALWFSGPVKIRG